VHTPQTRRRARERAVQFLFGLDFTQYTWQDAIEEFWQTNPTRASVKDYAMMLIEGVLGHLNDLDGAIIGALENWNWERVGRIERNVLRIAVYEMRYRDDVPEKVAINEAIEVAKQFSSPEAPRFVNGVLDKLTQNNPS
jgi:transcription antitermination protein NusB